jgi:phage-related protein
VEEFKGKIRSLIVYGDEFWDFLYAQTPKVQARILWTIRLIRDIQLVPQTYLKHLEGTDGLYEIRISSGNNIFRVFCFFDEGQLVILLNGFQKKTQKTPKSEIERAEKLKSRYYEDKQK